MTLQAGLEDCTGKASGRAILPRARTLVHPGAFNAVRIKSMSASSARHVRLLLMPGLSLHDALVAPLAEMGIEYASTTILGGNFRDLHYCVAPPDRTGRAVIAYSPPIDAGACAFIFGNATLGKSIAGDPLVHCHATFRDTHGAVKGGHVIAQTSIVATGAIPVLVTALDGFELRQAFDQETNIPLLQPCRSVDRHQETSHGS